MTNILEFKLPASHSAMTGETRCRADASEIILFPGVRYERWGDADEIAVSVATQLAETEAAPRRRVE